MLPWIDMVSSTHCQLLLSFLLLKEFALPALGCTLKQLLPLPHLQGTTLSKSITLCGLLYQYGSAGSPSHSLDISRLMSRA